MNEAEQTTFSVPSPGELEQLTELHKAMGDYTRMRILWYLMQKKELTPVCRRPLPFLLPSEYSPVHLIIPKNLSASTIAFAFSSGHPGCFASSVFALL